MIKKKYKMCGKAAFEGINHIIGECSKITHREYKGVMIGLEESSLGDL